MYTYIYQYPKDREMGWSHEINGVCHDENNWFFTQDGNLWKFPITHDINSVCNAPDAAKGILMVQEKLHFGDIDHYKGYIFVPVSDNVSIRIYRASDLSFVTEQIIKREDGNKFTSIGWVAINPINGYLYTSDKIASSVTTGNKSRIHIYKIGDLSKGNPLSFYSTITLCDFGRQVLEREHMQGGCFDNDNHLHIVNGFVTMHNGRAVSWANSSGGISVFRVNPYPEQGSVENVYRLDASNQKNGFRYQFNGAGDEPEGITYWDLDKDRRAPGMEGTLHAIMQNTIGSGATDFFFKHYRNTWPELTGSASIRGSYVNYSSSLMMESGVLAGVPADNRHYQWQVGSHGLGWKNIWGASGSRYTATMADKGYHLRVIVTAYGYSGSIIAGPSYVDNPRITGSAEIPSKVYCGQEVTVKLNGELGNVAIDQLDLVWERKGDNDQGWKRYIATGKTYTPTADDVGKKIRIYVSPREYSGTFDSNEAEVLALPELNGKISYTSSICCGNPISIGLSGDVCKIPREKLNFRWEYKKKLNIISRWYVIPDAYNSTYTPTEEYVGKTIHLRITSDGYNGSICSPEVVVGSMPELEGSIEFTSSIQFGTPITIKLIGNVCRVEQRKLHYQWQIKKALNSSFANITNAKTASYTPVASDIGKIIRVVITADGRKGEICSAQARVCKLNNSASPVSPDLKIKSPYNSIEVTNGKSNQEYIATDSSTKPENWNNSVSVANDGSIFLPCKRGTTVYVHTRHKETATQVAGQTSTYNSRYIPDKNYLNNLTLSKNSFIMSVGQVMILRVYPFPEDYKDWNDTCTVKWYVNGSGVKLYTNVKCTVPLTLSSPVSNKTVYVKAIEKTSSVTIGVEKQVGMNSNCVANCTVQVK